MIVPQRKSTQNVGETTTTVLGESRFRICVQLMNIHPADSIVRLYQNYDPGPV